MAVDGALIRSIAQSMLKVVRLGSMMVGTVVILLFVYFYFSPDFLKIGAIDCSYADNNTFNLTCSWQAAD